MLLNDAMNLPLNFPFWVTFELSKPPKMGDSGGFQECSDSTIHICIQQRPELSLNGSKDCEFNKTEDCVGCVERWRNAPYKHRCYLIHDS